MPENLQHIFLSYANNLFRNDPQNIQKVYDDIADSLAGGDASTRPKTLREAIVKVTAAITQETRSVGIAERLTQLIDDYLKDSLIPKQSFPWEIAFLTALNAVHGYENGFCENECPHRKRREFLGRELFLGKHRIKCHECEQYWFRLILEKLIAGAEYFEIEGFKYLVQQADSCFTRSIEFSNTPSSQPYEESLRAKPSLRVPNGWSLDSLDNKWMFNSFFSRLAGYSLIEFLLYNDRRKLKVCKFCEKIFIAKSLANKGKCYEKSCKNKMHQMDMRERRETDPVRYC